MISILEFIQLNKQQQYLNLSEALIDISTRDDQEVAHLNLAVQQLAKVVKNSQQDFILPAEEITEICHHGLYLLSKLSYIVEQQNLNSETEELNQVSLLFAYWCIQNNASLSDIGIIVNQLAWFANSIHEPPHLESLFNAITDIVQACDANLKLDPDKFDADRPWRHLILNYCIIATRSNNTNLMQQAFDCLCLYLPEEAADFFKTGMQQMQIIDYPEPVRMTMFHYYEMWQNTQRLQ